MLNKWVMRGGLLAMLLFNFSLATWAQSATGTISGNVSYATNGNTVTLAVRALRQDRIGHDLRTDLRADELGWLDADLG